MTGNHGGKRMGSGRPKKSDEEKRATTTVSLPQWLLTQLDEIGGTRSSKVQLALASHFGLSENKQGKIMKGRAYLSVGLNQDFSCCEVRKKFMPWLEEKEPFTPNAKAVLEHIHALEGLLSIEKYSTLSVVACELRDDLEEMRMIQSDCENRGFQRAINLIIEKMEDIDMNSQAATSISEIQSATLMQAAELIKSQDDYVVVTQLAMAISDGCE